MRTAPLPDVAIKAGDTLQLTMQFLDLNGAPVDLTGATITGQVRDPANLLVATPALSVTPIAGTVGILVADTSAWPLGLLRCDLKIVMAGVVSHSDTFGITVKGAVTP